MSDKLTPMTAAPLPVEMGVNEPIPTDEDTKQAFTEIGYVGMSANHIRNLHRIGAYTRGVGTIHIQRGRAMFNQQMLEDTLKFLFAEMARVSTVKHLKGRQKQMLALAREIANVSSKLTESQELVLESEKEVGASGRDMSDIPTAKFVPNRPVQIVAEKVEFKAR